MKISTIKLSHYDNISRYLKTYKSDIINTKQEDKYLSVQHKGTKYATKKIGNFYEFYINDEKLINVIGQAYWSRKNTEHFFDDSMGWIGLFDSYMDYIQANRFLLRSPSRQEIQDFFDNSAFQNKKSENTPDWVEEDFQSLSEVIQPKMVQLYGCICGDEMCQGLGVDISKNESFYIWDFGDDKLRLQFESEQYESAFEPFLSF